MFFNYNEENYYSYIEGYNLEDANELVIESYINDYTIFEAALRRDFMEATGILSEAADDNFLTKIWNKIVEFVEMIQEKIMALVKKFEAKMDESKKKKAKKIVDDYKKYYNGEKGELDDFGIKNFKLKTSVIVNGGNVDKLSIDNIAKDCDCDKLVSDLPYVDNITKDQIDDLKEKLDDVNMSDVRESIEEDLYEEDEIENPFDSNKSGVVSGLQNIILSNTANVRSIKDAKKDLVKEINKCKKDAKKKLSEIRKDKYSSKETKDDEKEKAHAYLSLMSALKKFLSTVVSQILKEVGNIYKESVRLYKAGGDYIKRKQDRIKDMKKNGGSYSTDINEEDSTDTNGESDSTSLNDNEELNQQTNTILVNSKKSKKKDRKARRLARKVNKETYFDTDYNTAIGEAAVFELGLDFDL